MTITHLMLFDIDGTLLHASGIGREATRRALLDVFGTEGTLATHHFGGKTDWLTLTEVLALSAEAVGAQMRQYERVLAQHMAELALDYEIRALPGALETVAHLRQRPDIALGIVTGNVSTTAPFKLRAAGFDPLWFPIGAYGSEALERDDLPVLALERAQQITQTVLAAQQVTIIGDTVADITCARAVGARAVAVTTGFAPRDQLVAAQPDYLLDDLHALLPLIN